MHKYTTCLWVSACKTCILHVWERTCVWSARPICVQMLRRKRAVRTARQLAGLLTGLCSLLIEGSQRWKSQPCSARPQYCPHCCYSSQSARREWDVLSQVFSRQVWAKDELNRFQTFGKQRNVWFVISRQPDSCATAEEFHCISTLTRILIQRPGKRNLKCTAQCAGLNGSTMFAGVVGLIVIHTFCKMEQINL